MSARIVVAIAAFGFIAFGAWIFISPISSLQLLGLPIEDSYAMRVEMRAFYGGLEIGIGLILVRCAMREEMVRFGLMLSAASYGMIGVARAIALLMEGEITAIFGIALGIEFAVAIVALLMLRKQ